MIFYLNNVKMIKTYKYYLILETEKIFNYINKIKKKNQLKRKHFMKKDNVRTDN